MKGRGAPPTDLLVCFPSRAHIALMPKAICSPARSADPNKRNHLHNHSYHHTRSNNRASQASPLLWVKTKSKMGSEISEPSSPKVTCAGQIKVKSKRRSCKNWQSVMEEIEKLHNKRKLKKKPTWIETFGFKKDIMQFLTCLRTIRFNLPCFGSFHVPDITSDEEEEEEDDGEEEGKVNQVSLEDSDDNDASRATFSKWFMVLQENQNNGFCKEREDREGFCDEVQYSDIEVPSDPPSNALLLMRCRSAPSTGWLKERKKEEEEEKEEENKEKLIMEEDKKESLLLMGYTPDFVKVSSDIVKETWVVGGTTDPLSRSRSWKRRSSLSW